MQVNARMSVVAVVGACASGALAQGIAIANPSFELPAMSPGGFTSTAPAGWSSGGGGTIGVFYPTVASWGYTAPHGNQLGYTNSGVLQQTLTEAVRPGVEYVLMVDVIHRPSFFQTYKIELLAGDTIVGVDNGSLRPPRGGSMVSAIAFTARAGDPLIGQPLTIRLSGPSQANFDNVRMTTCRVDLDGDGNLTIFDFLAFQNAFDGGSMVADFDGDGQLTIFDFLAFQNAFDAGCA
jgi:hypothetical protein